MTMQTDKIIEDDVRDLLVEARNAPNKEGSLLILRKARDLCKRIEASDNPNRYDLESEVLTEMATLTSMPSERASLWMKALNKISLGITKLRDHGLVEQLAKKTIDFLQDPFVTISLKDAIHILVNAKRRIDECSRDLPSELFSVLLARKSALLRQMASLQTTRVAKQKITERALRCAQKAATEHPDSWDAQLELGMTLWQVSEFEKGDKEFNHRLQEAEESFWKSSSIKETVYNLLALSMFFRTTYQTAPFLECFDNYALIEHNRRRYYDESYLFAEGVMQLWYSDYPSAFTELRLQEAERLLEQSISFGNSNARHIIDLAFTKAARGDVTVGRQILKTLHNLSTDVSWTDIAVMVSQIGPGDDLIAQGFAAGITESSTWNKLATFAIDFLDDIDLAVSLYRESLRIQPSNAVALTNLASALLSRGDRHSTEEANILISKAASCAHRRFRWWRNVREQIQQKLSERNVISCESGSPFPRFSLTHLSDLYRTFQLLKTSSDHQVRGFQLEKLINRLFKISLSNSFASYRAPQKWFQSPALQIDAAFCFFDSSFYRVETKWTADPVPPADIVLFHSKLDVVGVKGLFISIRGFTAEAIRRAYEYRNDRQILLMDGEELESILQGSPSLDEAIRIKQIYFAKESNPYFRIKASVQVESILI